MLRIWHHSEPFPHPTPIKVVQSGTIMFQQDMHCFYFRDFEIYTLLFYCGYFNVLNHKNHIIIVILWENREKKTVYPLGIFSVPTYLPLPSHLPTKVPPCIPPTYPCLPAYQSLSSMGARARKQIKVWLKLHKV